jgi:hypothetical protein
MSAVATQTRPRAQTTCPHCDSSIEPGQLICLGCGTRLALDYRRPPGWKLPLVVLLAVFAGAAAVFALGLDQITNDAGKEAAKAPAGKRDTVLAAPEKGKASGEEPRKNTRKQPAAAPRRSKPPGRAPRPGGIPSWPAGRNGFTVVVASMGDLASARKAAQQLRATGTRAGVLRSNDFTSLEPGFWIVFSGVYGGRPQAERAAFRLARAYPGAFPQFVNGSQSAR